MTGHTMYVTKERPGWTVACQCGDGVEAVPTEADALYLVSHHRAGGSLAATADCSTCGLRYISHPTTACSTGYQRKAARSASKDASGTGY